MVVDTFYVFYGSWCLLVCFLLVFWYIVVVPSNVLYLLVLLGSFWCSLVILGNIWWLFLILLCCSTF